MGGAAGARHRPPCAPRSTAARAVRRCMSMRSGGSGKAARRGWASGSVTGHGGRQSSRRRRRSSTSARSPTRAGTARGACSCARRCVLAGVEREIEINLTDRRGMLFPMLLGRTALGAGVHRRSGAFLPPWTPAPRGCRCLHREFASMKLAILSRNTKLYSTRRLVEAARDRGHSVRVLDPLRCYMRIASDGFAMHYKGRPLSGYHAVIPRIGASITRYGIGGAAPVRADGQLHAQPVRRDPAARATSCAATSCWRRKGIGLPVDGVRRQPRRHRTTCWRCSARRRT